MDPDISHLSATVNKHNTLIHHVTNENYASSPTIFIDDVWLYIYRKIRLSNNSLTNYNGTGKSKSNEFEQNRIWNTALTLRTLLDIPDWANVHFLDWTDLYLLDWTNLYVFRILYILSSKCLNG
jgi:hypothetical protein